MFFFILMCLLLLFRFVFKNNNKQQQITTTISVAGVKEWHYDENRRSIFAREEGWIFWHSNGSSAFQSYTILLKGRRKRCWLKTTVEKIQVRIKQHKGGHIFKYFLRKGKYLLKRVFVSVLLLLFLLLLFLLLLCLKMLIFVLFYINPCVFTSTRDSWKFVVLAFVVVKFEVVWNISFVCCSVHHCDAWEVFQDHRSI